MPKKTTRKAAAANKSLNFEDALKELETLVERMEKGELSLEDALKDFERGIELTRTCQQALKAAEQKVQVLMSQGDKDELVPFEEQD